MPSVQSSRWVFTINNPTPADRTHVVHLGESESIKYLVAGREHGESGTPHLQGFVIFNRSVRRARVASALPRAHLEVARGTSEQAATYCKKEGDFDEYGTFPENNKSNPYLDQLYAWGDAFIAEKGRAPTSPEIAKEHPTAYLRYPRVCKLFTHRAPAPVLEQGEARPWQGQLEEYLNEDADDRSIRFYVDHDGGKGKSWFQRYYFSKFPHKTQILSSGKRDDVAHVIDPTKSVFFFNIPRGGMEYLQYTILEQLKDRMVFSPKYNSQMKFLLCVPHVVVFSNEQPDYTKMSNDRYDVINEF